MLTVYHYSLDVRHLFILYTTPVAAIHRSRFSCCHFCCYCRRSLLAATVQADFFKAVMLRSGLPLPGDLRRRVLRFWDKPVSLLGLVRFSAESVPGGDFSVERERVDDDLRRLGYVWYFRCSRVVRALAAVGFTNGAAMCLRGWYSSYSSVNIQ